MDQGGDTEVDTYQLHLKYSESGYSDDMTEERPLWRQLFDLLEKELAPKLREFAGSGGIVELVSGLTRFRFQLERSLEELSSEFLRTWNLPSGSDLRMLSDQINAIDRRLREMSKALDEIRSRVEG